MPIEYSIFRGGHFVHATATYPVTSQEFIEYEMSHAIHKEIKSPFSELLEIRNNALKHITKDDMSRVLQRKAEIRRLPMPHRCAIVVLYGDTHSWNLAKFYEGMVILHSPESVIVFGNINTAKVWLGVEDIYLKEDMNGNQQ
jgi:hypothetical protein